MNDTHPPSGVLDDESRRFLRRTGVAVILIEIIVLAGALWFQLHFGR
ncbi:MAG: hypothetical protein AB1806_15945 [Acidobacteriota bacterium]